MSGFEEATKLFGNPDETGNANVQPSGQPAQSNFDLATKLFGHPDETSAQKEAAKTVALRPPEEGQYEEKIQKHAEGAKKQVAEEGATGAFMHGLGNVPLVGPAYQSAKRYVEAYSGQGEGSSFEERKEDLKAQREAYNREVSAQHPYAETAGELTQALPMVFVPGVGWAAGAARAATLPKLGRAAATAAELAGWGAEGAAWGAGTALGEKEFGTKQPSEQKSVTEGAEHGAMFGAGVAGAGKLIGGAFSKLAPDWLAGFTNKDKHASETFMQKMYTDFQNGNLNVNPTEHAERIAKGEPLSWFDVRGPETDRWLQQKFKNNPQGLENFKASMNERLADAPERTQQFLRKMAGVEGEFDVNAVRTQARALAEKKNAENFADAHHPDNGRGSWSEDWDKTLADNKEVGKVIDSVADTMSAVKGGKFENPFGARGEMGLEQTGLDKGTIRTLNENGIGTLNDLNKMTKEDVAAVFDLGGNIATDTGRAPDVSHIYDMLKKPLNGVNLNERVLLRPEAANIEFMDNLQQKLTARANELENIASTTAEKTYVNQIKELGSNIRTALTDENSSLYNKSFAKAHAQREMAHLTDDALTAGQNFLKKINNREYIDKAANDAAKMSDEEKAFFKYGLLAEIEHSGVVGGGVQTGAPQNVALAYKKIQNWFAKPNIKKGLENVLGEKEFNDLQNHLTSEVFYKDAYSRALTLGAKGDLISQFLRNSWIPGIGGIAEYFMHGTPFFPAASIIAKTANYYYGGNYGRALADQLVSKDPVQLNAAYKKAFVNPKVLIDVNNQLAAMAYVASVQAGETKYDSKKINQFTQGMNEYQKKAVDQAILQAVNLYKTTKKVAGAAGQAAGFNQGGRVEYGDGGRTLTQPIDPSEAGRKTRMAESGLTNPVYHGTKGDFNEFNKGAANPLKQYLPLVLGTHVAKDPEVSNTFTMKQSLNNEDVPHQGGNVMPLMTHEDKHFHPVNQPVRNGKQARHDDDDVTTEVMQHLIRENPSLGYEIFESQRRLSPKDAKKAVNDLLQNKYYSKEEKEKNLHPNDDLRTYLALKAITAPMDSEKRYAKMYSRSMRAKGFKGLKYTNTSWDETQDAKDPTAYIVFHPEEDSTDWHPLRSKFAKFDPAKKSSRDIRESHGGFVRRNRATGGRIPEADKLFKDAKKYIDSRTKGLLNEPDEKIVHALKIAKARNS